MKERLNVWNTHDVIYKMHWGGAQTTLSGRGMLMIHDIVQILCNKPFFVTLYFGKLEKTFSLQDRLKCW